MIDTVREKKGDSFKEKTIAIDATDLLILDWFTNFYPQMKKKIIDGKEYGWIKLSKVIEDLPILRINEKSVGARLKKLVHFKLLDYRVVYDKGKSAYFTHGESFPQLLYDFSTMSDSERAVKQPFKGRSNSLSKGGQTPIKDSKLDSNNRYDLDLKNQRAGQFTPPHPIKCPECGNTAMYNIQVGCFECNGCYTKVCAKCGEKREYDRESDRYMCGCV